MKKKLLVIVFSLVYLFVLDAGFLLAQIEDTTPPEVLSFDFNPKVINVSNGGATINVTVGAQDNLSGVSSGFITFKNGPQAYATGLNIFNNGVLSGTVIIPQFALAGTYTVVDFGVVDRVGNQKRLTTADLEALGYPTQLFNGNTPPGQNIIVGPISGVTITYPQVTQGGQTTVASSSSGTTPPSGFKFGNPPTYYSISTTAQFNPPVAVCISYDDTQFKNEKNLKLFHFANGQWVNVTTSLDTINNIICGSVSSFSEFGLFEDMTIDHIADEVKSFNLEPGIQQGLLAKLDAAKSAIERGQNKTARNILKAFINLVKAQEGKKITNEQANILRADAQALINQFGGNLLSTIFKWVLFGWLDKFINATLSVKL